MSKEKKKGNREIKKPKATDPKIDPPAAGLMSGLPDRATPPKPSRK